MQPNDPSPAPPPIDPSQIPQNGNNPYDFITNPEQPKKKSLLPSMPSGNSKGQRVIIVIGGVIIIIMLLIIGSSLLGRGSKAQKEQLKDVVYQQKELIRIATIGEDKATSTEARNLAVSTKLSLTSEQSELQSALKTLGVKSDAKSLGGPNKQTDAKLTAAEQANNFDEVFIEIMRADLLKYAKSLQISYKQNSSKKTKSALESQFKNAAILAGYNEE